MEHRCRREAARRGGPHVADPSAAAVRAAPDVCERMQWKRAWSEEAISKGCRLMMSRGRQRQGGPYRARDGIILGVCRGVAEHLEMSVFWTRVVALVILVVTGLWPVVGLYFLAALLMKPEPVVPLESEADEEFYHSFSSSRQMALRRLKLTFDRLDRRIRHIEGMVTAREYQWHERLGQ